MIRRARQAFARHPSALGLAGAVLLLVGGAWYQALVTPPYRFVDEQAHAGYVLAIQAGELPTIDTPIRAGDGGEALQARLRVQPERRTHVWVANNPPLTAALSAGPSAATRALGVPGGPLVGLRLLNAAAAGGAIVLAFRLGRHLAGDDTTTGLIAAALVAATPHVGFVVSLGYNDGVAMLATTGLLLALARVCDGVGAGRTGRRRVIELGAWCAFASATRPMALVLAAAAGLLGLLAIWWKRELPLRWAVGWLALPTLITSGWFYVLNVVRYGDPTGSGALFDKFLREPNGTLWSTLTTRGIWESLLRTTTSRRLEIPLPVPESWYVLAVATLGIGGVVTLLLAVAAAIRSRGAAAVAAGDVPWRSWAALAAISVVPVLLTAQHRAGGGASHARYLLPILPIAMASVAVAAVRLAGAWLGLALVAAFTTITFLQTRRSARWLAGNPDGPPGSELVVPIGPELLRGAGLAAAAVGLLLVMMATLQIARR